MSDSLVTHFQVFASERVEYHGQPLGLLVATNKTAAQAGLAAVKVTYDDIQAPVTTIEEALTKPLPPNPFPPVVIGDVEGERLPPHGSTPQASTTLFCLSLGS